MVLTRASISRSGSDAKYIAKKTAVVDTGTSHMVLILISPRLIWFNSLLKTMKIPKLSPQDI